MPSQNANDNPRIESLTVSDALSYLDAIKSECQEQPDIYNQFLALMSQFKASQIDTRTTVERVAVLFSGYPSLILGFNLFLPVGYEIKYAKDGLGANFITVTTPGGKTIDLPSTS
ncbi:PAH2 domain-containing protein [Phlegmacium glaucopus]|nr:PAH2 domain-containing protein [Phlegmacium glaucopus]